MQTSFSIMPGGITSLGERASGKTVFAYRNWSEMMPIIWNKIFSVLLVLFTLTAYAQPEIQQVATDQTPPALNHEPVRRVTEGQPLTLTVRASDDTGLDRVRLLYRSDALSEFREVLFQSIENDRYEVMLDANDLQGSRIDYYVEAIDKAGNVTALGNGITPLVVTVITPVHESDRWGWKKVLGAVVVAAVFGSFIGGKEDGGGGDTPTSGPNPPTPDTSAEVTIIGVSVPSQ